MAKKRAKRRITRKVKKTYVAGSGRKFREVEPPQPSVTPPQPPVTAMSFGRAIRTVRGLKGVTQVDLAKAANLSSNTVARLERGEITPSFKTILKLSMALDSRPSAIFGFAEV